MEIETESSVSGTVIFGAISYVGESERLNFVCGVELSDSQIKVIDIFELRRHLLQVDAAKDPPQ